MKKIVSIIMTMCMMITGMPMMVYAASSTPEISLEEFSEQLKELQAEYDENYVSEITIEDGSEFYHIDGEAFPLSVDADILSEVTDDDFEIPLSAISDYCDIPEISAYSLEENTNDITVDKETAEYLGFEVEFEDDTAVLTQPYQTKRLIVKSEYDINPLDSVAIVEGYNDLHIVQFDNQESAKDAQEYYENQRLVEYAEPDLVVSTLDYDDVEATSSDETLCINYGNHLSWGSEDIGVDDYIDYLGDISELPEIVIGIIDTGIDIDHEFLKDRIIRTNYNISTTGEADSEDDDKGHGTHVAGIVVDNTTSNVKVKGYKVLSSTGTGTIGDAAIAVDYAVADGVNIINMSLGTKGASKTMENAVNAATDIGVTVCVSAGNSGRDASQYCPAGIEKCITVMAYGKDGDIYSRPFWTNWGNGVDFAAPGVSIYSTYLSNGYETLSGTSMASPFVAAASAMLLSKNTDLIADEICSLLEENARKMHDAYDNYLLIYIGTITEYNQDRTIAPEFSVESGRYSDSVTVELTCSEENAEIYYTLDGSRASKSNGILYTEPIVIDKVTRIHAAAYAGDKLKSLQAIADYYITVTDPEGNFEIDTNGIITAYNGTNNYLTIPDTIAGITVTGIGTSVFASSDIVMIKFPDTLTYVGQKAFYHCDNLVAVYCTNLKTLGKWAFRLCRKLETIDLTKLEEIDEYGLGSCNSIPALYNDKLTTVGKCALIGLRGAINIDLPNVTYVGYWGLNGLNSAEYINLPKVETISYGGLESAYAVEILNLPELKTVEYSGATSGCFANMVNLKEFIAPKLTNVIQGLFRGSYALETVYIPSVTEIGVSAFEFCSAVKTIFAPSLETITNLPTCDGVTLYLSDRFTSSDNPTYDYTIIAPSSSYAQQWAEENGYTFIPSDYRDIANDNLDNTDDVNVRANGRSIRVTNTGLRFGFEWESIPEIEQLASNIEYGFVYHYNYDNEPFGSDKLTADNVGTDSIKQKTAVNLDDTNDGKTIFNLVFTNIPDKNHTTNISVRAYVCIDGMYFYSNTLNGSFSEVAGLVLADEEIDQNTKNAVNNLLAKEV